MQLLRNAMASSSRQKLYLRDGANLGGEGGTLGKAEALLSWESWESREGRRGTLKQQTFCFLLPGFW